MVTFEQVEKGFFLIIFGGAIVFFVGAFIKGITTKEWK